MTGHEHPVTGRPDLSPHQRRVLAATIALHGVDGPVTLRAIADELGLAKSTVFHHLLNLRRLGLVDSAHGSTATIHPHPHLVLIAGHPCAAIPIGSDR